MELLIIFLREDLKIANVCKSAKENLLTTLTGEHYFSDELRKHFIQENPQIPFEILDTDPSQVAIFKKLINALENTEKALREIEEINIERNRYTASVAADIVKASYYAIHEMYGILQLINHSNADIQNIVGPHLQTLMPQLALVSQSLDQLRPEHPEESAGVMLADVIKMLPQKKETVQGSLETLNKLIFELPHYFEELQKLIAVDTLKNTNESITKTKKYQATTRKNTNQSQKYLERLNIASEIPAFVSYLSLIKTLTSHTRFLLALPLTNQAYLLAAEKLNDIKHNILPQIISELEKTEESMALKPGLLTEPAIKQMDTYYTKLAMQIDEMAKTTGVINSTQVSMPQKILISSKNKEKKITPVADLTVMMDDVFFAKRRAKQLERLHEIQFSAQDNTKKEAAERFFDKVGSFSPIWYSWSLAKLSDSDKEILVNEYRLIQPYFAALYPDTDQLIVDALTKPTNTGILYSVDFRQLWGSNHFATILVCKKSVLSSIEQDIAQAKFKEKLIEKTMNHTDATYNNGASIQVVIPQKKTIQQEQTATTPLQAMGAELGKKTLFGIVSELKLSESVDEFLMGNFQDYLKQNLSLTLWAELASPDGETLDFTKIPYSQFHATSPEIEMYQQVINSIYYMREGLKKLESLNSYGDPGYIYYRSQFVITSRALLIDIMASKNNLIKATKNPGLKAIVQEGLDLLEPMKQLPMIGDYLKTSAKVAVIAPDERNIIQEWNEQQELVKKAVEPEEFLQALPENPIPHTPEPLKAKLENSNNSEALDTISIQLIAEKLYQIPIALTQIKNGASPQEVDKQIIDANVQAFVNGLNDLSFGPKSAKKILKTITKLQIQLSDIGFLSRELAITRLKEIRSEFGTILIAAADDTEFHLGLKPGTYSSVVSDRFDKFYTALVVNMPLEKEQTGLELLIDLTSTQKRLLREEERLETVMTNQTAEETYKAIFGADYDQINPSGNSPFQKLKNIQREDDFTDQTTQEKFLETYAEIQPYLEKINKKYDRHYFLRELQTPEDFNAALNNILDEQSHLYEIIDAMDNTKRMRVNLCNERSRHFNELLKHQREIIGPEKIEAFKEKIFNNYMVAHVEKSLAITIGSTHAKVFLNQIMPDFLAEQPKIFSNITLSDDIEEKITTAINKLSKGIIEKHETRFKETLFNDHINNVITNSLKNELGIYTELFMKKISPAYESKRSAVLANISFDATMGTKINTKVDQITPEILQNNAELKTALTQLNQKLNEINKVIDQEKEKPENNPCRAKKLTLLTSLKKEISHLNNIPDEDTALFLQEATVQTEQSLEKIKDYDALIKVYDTLNSLKETMSQEDDLSPNKEEKIATISAIQRILIDAEKNIPMRLEQVLQKLNESSQADILKDSDNLLIGEAYKGQIFTNYIKTELHAQLHQELGSYTDVFLQKITPDFINKKTEILSHLAIEDIEETIAEQFTAHIPAIMEKNKELKTICVQLKISLDEIDRLIQREERNPQENPCRQEKIDALNEYKVILQNTANIPAHEAMEFLKNRKNNVAKFMMSLHHYNKLISVYDSLNTMKQYVMENDNSSEQVKSAKIAQISLMQEMLTTPKKPAERLVDVKQHGLSNSCQTILRENSDNFFIRLIKKFISLFIGPSREKATLSLFKTHLNTIKEETKPGKNKNLIDEEQDANHHSPDYDSIDVV